MKHSTMANLLRGIIIMLGGCGLFVHIWGLPKIAQDPHSLTLVSLEWNILVGVALLPCYAALVIAWLVAGSIAEEKEFSKRNATLFRWIFGLAVGDSVFFAVGNVILYILDRAYVWNVLVAILLAAIGICVAVCAAVLSHLIDKAAGLQEDSELTI